MWSKSEAEERIFAVMFVYESNLIENINVSYETIFQKYGFDANNNFGHIGALVSADLAAFAKSCLLTEKMIKDWQKLIIQEQNSWSLDPEAIIHEKDIGKYRGRGKMFVGGKRCVVPFEAVSGCMKNLIEEINFFQQLSNKLKEDDIVKKIADFHFDFLWIHPFVDGNGRTSRILTWYLFKYFNLKPFIFTNADKLETYYKAFDGMREYFAQKSAL